MRIRVATGIAAVAGVLMWAAPQGAAASFSWSAPLAVQPGIVMSGVACASASQCTVLAGDGQVWTFDPASPGTPAPEALPAILVGSLACPSTSQCITISLGPELLRFDPFAPGLGSATPLPEVAGGSPVCPSSIQCTTLAEDGQEITFNPGAPGEPVPVTIDATEPGNSLQGLSCPIATQCTALDIAGNEITFNPQSPGSPKAVSLGLLEGSVRAVACPSAHQCTEVGVEGEVTFDPTAGGILSRSDLGGGNNYDVACPSPTQCTSVGYDYPRGEQATTFNPAAPSSADTTTIFAAELNALEVACPTTTRCVVVDEEGNAFIGSVAGPPANISPPKISGTAEEGQTLTEEHGLWSNHPTRFTYQWEDCNDAGSECSPIKGASTQTYVLAPQDVGHTIRVQESATNESGTGGPATSSATAVVQPSEGGRLEGEQGGPPNESEMPTTCPCGKPVNTATGVFWHAFTDAQVPGLGVPLDFTRTYSSQDATHAGMLGYGWTNSYETRLTFDALGNASVAQQNGAVVSFKAKASSYEPLPGVLGTLMRNGDGTFTFSRNFTNEHFVFNGAGQLVSEIDRHGYKTVLTYDGAGNLTQVTDQAKRTLTLAYTAGRLTSLTDPLGHTTTYVYDGAGNLSTTTDPLGRTWHFAYDGAHRLVSMADPKTGVTTNTFDSSGRVTKQVDAAGRTLTIAYSGDTASPSGGTTTVTDARGLQTQYVYKMEQLAALTAALGTGEAATTTYQYDTATNGPVKVTDAIGKTTTNGFDSRGDLLSTTDPLGKTTKYSYDSEGDRLTATDAIGVTTTYTYDGTGNMLAQSTPLSGGGNATSTYAYGSGAQTGDRLSSTNPRGKTTTYTYDAAGDQTSITDPLANKTTMAYDANGRLLARTSPNGGTTTNAYDLDGEPSKTTDPLGHSTTYAYDPNGNRSSVTDANGHTTTYTYDADNERTQTTQPDGSTTKTGYDSDGNIISQTDGNGHTTGYSFNALNQTTASTDPDGRTTKYSSDRVGNVLASVNPSAQTTMYAYDADRRVTAIAYSDGTTPAVRESYDADGRRVSLADGTGTTTFAYDSLGRLTSETNGAGATSGYTYDPAGNVTQITYPNGKAVSRSFYADNRLKESTDWLGNTTTFAYDGDGNLTAEHLPGTVTAESAYNAADQLTGITDKNSGSSSLATFTYIRDAIGQVATSNTTGASASTNNYVYDSQNRITADNASGYAYDAGNNPTSFNGQPQRFDAADQLLVAGTTPTGGGETGGGGPGSGEPGGGGSSTSSPPVEHGGTAPFRASSPSPVTIAARAKAHSTTKQGKLTTGPLTTKSANQLVLAFVSAQGPNHGQRVRGISGGRFHWSLVTEATSAQGTSSIWQARAPRPLAHATFTATLAKTGYSGMLDVLAFAPGATVGSVTKRSGAHSSPSLGLKASGAATILAVAHDSGPAHARKALAGNHVSDHALGGKHGGTSWTLSAPGGTATIGLAGPKSSSWSIAALAVLPGATTARAATAHKPSVVTPSLPAAFAPSHSTAPLAASPSGETTYTYNAQGDRTSVITPAGTTTLSYDQANRLTAVAEGARYSYDGDGLRTSKTAGGAPTAFAWDKSDELPLLLQGGDTSYIYGPSGEPTEQITGSTATYLLSDQQGSTRLLTNSAGAVVGAYSYDAWGNVRSHTGEAATNLQYDGQYTDAETGYQYLRARYYDPGTGQFLTQDPQLRKTRTPYVFAVNNPVNSSDPTGAAPTEQCPFRAAWAWAHKQWDRYAAGPVEYWDEYGAPVAEQLDRYYALKKGDLLGYVEAGVSWWQEASLEAADYLYGVRATIATDIQEAGPGFGVLNWQKRQHGSYASNKAQADAVLNN